MIYVIPDIVQLIDEPKTASKIFLLLKPSFEILAFSISKSLKKAVQEEIIEKISVFSKECSEKNILANYIFKFAKDESVNNKVREELYKIVEALELEQKEEDWNNEKKQ